LIRNKRKELYKSGKINVRRINGLKNQFKEFPLILELIIKSHFGD